MRDGRPIGQNMRELCELVERHGPCGPAKLYPLTALGKNDVRTYLGRAVGRGMLVRDDRGTYKTARNWQDYLAVSKRQVEVRPPEPEAPRRPHPLEGWLAV